MTQNFIPRSTTYCQQESWGDTMHDNQDNTFRVFFQNVCGLHLQKTVMDLQFYMETMKNYQVGLYGWSETKTNWLNLETKMEYRERSVRTFKLQKVPFQPAPFPQFLIINQGAWSRQ